MSPRSELNDDISTMQASRWSLIEGAFDSDAMRELLEKTRQMGSCHVWEGEGQTPRNAAFTAYTGATPQSHLSTRCRREGCINPLHAQDGLCIVRRASSSTTK